MRSKIVISILLFVSGSFLLMTDPSLATLQPAAKPKTPIAKNYAPGEFIVKLKSEGPQAVSPCATCSLGSVQNFQATTADRSASLDQLNKRYGVTTSESVFIKRNDVNAQQAKNQFNALLTNTRNQAVSNMPAASQSSELPELSNIFLFKVAQDANIEEICAKYRQDPHVEYAQPNYWVEPQLVPNDPYYSTKGSFGQSYDDLWGLKANQMNMAPAWDLTQGEGRIVGVLDTGVDYNHLELLGNIWLNSREIAGNGRDDDGNGYIDDIRGWDFANRDNDPMDDHGHGTHVAGTIAAVGNNAIGIIGVAPKAKIMPLKGLGVNGGASSQLAEGLVYAAVNGADVINNSWGCSASCPSNPVVEDAVRTAYSLGTAVIFAAGNANSDVVKFSPNNIPETFTVGASTPNLTRASFSNFGLGIDVTAPGGGVSGDPFERNILSLKAVNASAAMTGSGTLIVGSNYLRQAGTSMAAPHAAGLAALIAARHPEYTVDEIYSAMRSSTDDINLPGFDTQTGHGRLNAQKALNVTNPCVAVLKSPKGGTMALSQNKVSVTGTATCRVSSTYTLEVGQGETPQTWAVVASGNSPLINSTIADVDLSSYGDGLITLRLTVRDVNAKLYRDHTQVFMVRDVHQGWPKDFGLFAGPALFADLNGDGQKDIILRGPQHTFAFRHDGSAIPGWPIDWRALRPDQTGASNYPAIGDLDANGSPELVIPAVFNYIYVFNSNATVKSGWPVDVRRQANNINLDNVVLADLDGDSFLEIMTAGIDFQSSTGPVGYLFVYDNQGRPKPNWPKQFNFPNQGNKVTRLYAADMTGDGLPEIILMTDTSGIAVTVYDRFGNILPGWPKSLSSGEQFYTSQAAFADLNNDGKAEIIISTTRFEGGLFPKTMHVLKSDASYAPGWPKNVDSIFSNPGGWLNSPTIGDFNADGVPEIVVSAGAGDGLSSKLAVFKSDASLLPGWPVTVPFGSANAPCIADLDGDGFLDLISGGFGGVFVYNRNGQPLSGWPKLFPGYNGTSVSLADVDGDGKIEVMAGGGLNTSIFMFDTNAPANESLFEWPNFLRDPQHTSWYNPKSQTTSSSATFVKTDTTTKGTWKGVYGADGKVIVNDVTALPAYAQVTPENHLTYTWAGSTGDIRGLLKNASSDRLATTWYSGGSNTFDVKINLTDNLPHQVALYMVDWDINARAQTVQVLDQGTGQLLDSRSLSGFNGGVYFVYNIKGNVTFRFFRTAGYNAVVSGIFFGAGGTTTPSASFSLSYQGKVRDKVGASNSATSGDGQMDGTFQLTVASGSGTVQSVELTRTQGGYWNSTIGSSGWITGVANSLDGGLLNSSGFSLGMNSGQSIYLFASDSGNSLFTPGSSYTVKVNLSDGTNKTASVTIP